MSLLDLSPCPILYSEKIHLSQTPEMMAGETQQALERGKEREALVSGFLFLTKENEKGVGCGFPKNIKIGTSRAPVRWSGWLSLRFSLSRPTAHDLNPVYPRRAESKCFFQNACFCFVLFFKKSFGCQRASSIQELRLCQYYIILFRVCQEVFHLFLPFTKKFLTNISKSVEVVWFSRVFLVPHDAAYYSMWQADVKTVFAFRSKRFGTAFDRPVPPPMYGSTCQAVVEQWLPGAYLGMFFELALFSGFPLMCPQFSVVEMQPSSVDA